MPTPAGIYYDGDFTVASPAGGLEIDAPFPFQPTTLVYRQRFQQFLFNPSTGTPCFKPLSMSTLPAASGMTPAVSPTGLTGPFLVEETPLVDIGAGIREWTRVWATVPFSIYEFPALNYSRQNYAVSTIPWTGWFDRWGNFHGSYRTFTSLEEWPEPLCGIVHRRFVRVPDTYPPEKILAMCKPQIPFRIVKITDERGAEHVFQFGEKGVAEPTTITRWMGEIREIRDVYVQPDVILGQNFGEWLTSAGFSIANLPPTATIDGSGNVIGFTPNLISGF